MKLYFANKKLKNAARTSSLAAALAGWVLLSALNVFVMWALQDRARLVRDNDNERILNTLFAEMRNYSDFGSAIESNPVLKERIIGTAIYENNLRPAYQWGKVPPVFDEEIAGSADRFRFGRYTIPNRRGRSAQFVIHYERMGPPPGGTSGQTPNSPPGQQRERARQTDEGQVEPKPDRGGAQRFLFRSGGDSPPEQNSLFFNSLARGRYFYTDISHVAYWRTRTLTAVVFPLVEIIMLFVVLYIRRLYLRNREYREKIESQQNLVVLGTAAGTLAHEIKNPLLSIRLQTGILEKLKGGEGKDEIRIINQEVERLSALIYRVNDYLREPDGEKSPFNIIELLRETSLRLCGNDIVNTIDNADGDDSIVFADKNRIRSVLENIIRNAMDSGSPLDGIGATTAVNRQDAQIEIRVFDRGRGIAEKNLRRVFDPFFTTKSTGTGIGLAISKRFTEAAGGSITVENRAGGESGGTGIVVTLVFPLYGGEEG